MNKKNIFAYLSTSLTLAQSWIDGNESLIQLVWCEKSVRKSAAFSYWILPSYGWMSVSRCKCSCIKTSVFSSSFRWGGFSQSLWATLARSSRWSALVHRYLCLLFDIPRVSSVLCISPAPHEADWGSSRFRSWAIKISAPIFDNDVSEILFSSSVASNSK